MDFRQLQAFVTLAETLHFRQAAEQLRIAQPHLSRRIKQLEDDLDVVLFYRNKRNVRLSEAGEVFLADARTLLKDAESARDHARESARGRRGKLRISLISSAMLGALPSILGDFHRRYPEVQLSFRELGSVVQLDALAHNASDVAFFHPPIRAAGLFEHITLERQPLVAALARDHRLAGRASLNLAQLAKEPWVMFPRADSAPIYDRIIAACHRAGFSPNIVQEAGPVHTRLGLVAAGFGVHLVQNAWRAIPFPGVVYVPTEPAASISLACYWRKNDPNPILRTFIDIVRRSRPRPAA